MKYTFSDRSKGIEANYRSILYQLVRSLIKLAKKAKGDIDKFNQYASDYSSTKSFKRYCYLASKRMVTPVANINAQTWRQAARRSTKSRLIYKSLVQNINSGLDQSIAEQIERNAQTISTSPLDVSRKVTRKIYEGTISGKRASTLTKEITQFTREYSRASAKLIARTEVSKTQTAITRSRSANLRINWYVWRTEEDQKVRDSHRTMDDVIVPWNSPPSPELLTNLPPAKGNAYYHAGEIYNCRCYPEPLLEVSDVRWPHKVYYLGKIQTMTRQQFEKIY